MSWWHKLMGMEVPTTSKVYPVERTAYMVLFIDRDTLRISGAGIFSDPQPTSPDPTVVLFKVSADSFGEAWDRAKEIARNPAYTWLRPLLKGSDR